jgi:hypothetical protein
MSAITQNAPTGHGFASSDVQADVRYAIAQNAPSLYPEIPLIKIPAALQACRIITECMNALLGAVLFLFSSHKQG